MLNGKPLISVQLDLEGCAYDLYVNGGRVAADMSGAPARERHPINHWLRSGRNHLELVVVKWEGQPDACEGKVEVLVGDAERADAEPVRLLTLAHSAVGTAAGSPTRGSSPAGAFDSADGFRPSERGDVVVEPVEAGRLQGQAEHVHAFSRTFELGLPLPEWAFFRSERMKQSCLYEGPEQFRPEYDALLAAYQELWSLLSRRDVGDFLDACEERSRETDAAYYKKPGETRERLRELL